MCRGREGRGRGGKVIDEDWWRRLNSAGSNHYNTNIFCALPSPHPAHPHTQMYPSMICSTFLGNENVFLLNLQILLAPVNQNKHRFCHTHTRTDMVAMCNSMCKQIIFIPIIIINTTLGRLQTNPQRPRQAGRERGKRRTETQMCKHSKWERRVRQSSLSPAWRV